MKMTREWAMPSADTFDVTPIHNFLWKYLHQAKVSIDPFARNKQWATHTNDLNPDTAAEHHLDAHDFLELLIQRGVRADLCIFDPPYSPRQVMELYQGIGRTMTQGDGQTCASWSRCRDMINELLTDEGIVLSFGWNSMGMGKKHGFDILEVLLVCHGAAHNDTICVAEKRVQTTLFKSSHAEAELSG